MKTISTLLSAALALVFVGGCSKDSTSDVTIGYSASEFTGSAASAVLGVIAPAADGSVDILYASPFLPPDRLELSNLSITRTDAEVVILAFSEPLTGIQPTFLPSSAQKGNLVHLPPTEIFHAPVRGARSFVSLASSDPKASLIQAFADMVCVDSSVLLVVTPTPTPSPTPTPTPTPTVTPTPDVTPPTVVSMSPPKNSFGINPISSVTITFSEPILPASVSTSSFSLVEAGLAVPGSILVNANSATFTPSRRLSLVSKVTVTLTSSVLDLAGNGLTPYTGQFTTRDGSYLPDDILELDPTNGVTSTYVAAMDGAGNGIVIWPQFDGTRTNLYSRYRKAGQTWDAIELVETSDLGSAASPQVAFGPFGEAIAVWNQSDGVRNHVYGNRFDPSQPVGQRWGSAVFVENTVGAGATLLPKLRMDTNGNATAVWMQPDPGSSTRSVWSNRYDGVTKTWGSQAVTIENQTTNILVPNTAMAADNAGNVYVAWPQLDSASKTSIFVARYVVGSGWVFAVPIESLATTMASPQVAVDPVTQEAMVVWNETDSTASPALRRLLVNRFSGGAWGTTPDILDLESDGVSTLSAVQLSSDATGISALWQHNVYDSVSGFTTARLFFRRYTSALNWSPVDILASSTDHTYNSNFQLGLDRAGNGIVLWEQILSAYELISKRYVFGFGWLSDDPRNSNASQELFKLVVSPIGNGLACWLHPNPASLPTVVYGLKCSVFE